MDNIKDFVSSVLLNNNVQAKELFNDLVSARAMEKLAERKQEIAQSLFQTEETVVVEKEAVEEGALKEEVELHEISARLLARAAHSASDPDNEYLDVKDHDPQKFADYAKKTKSAKDAKRVQAAADGEGHWPGGKKIRSYMNKKP